MIQFLDPDPNQRLTDLDDIKNHPFFEGKIIISFTYKILPFLSCNSPIEIEWDKLQDQNPPISIKPFNLTKKKSSTAVDKPWEHFNEKDNCRLSKKQQSQLKHKKFEQARLDLLHDQNLTIYNSSQ